MGSIVWNGILPKSGFNGGNTASWAQKRRRKVTRFRVPKWDLCATWLSGFVTTGMPGLHLSGAAEEELEGTVVERVAPAGIQQSL